MASIPTLPIDDGLVDGTECEGIYDFNSNDVHIGVRIELTEYADTYELAHYDGIRHGDRRADC